MGTAVSVLRGAHIAAGVLALVVFWVPLAVQKGNTLHRRAGRVYVYAMFVAAVTAMLLAPLRIMQRPPERWAAPIYLAYVALLGFAAAFYGLRVLQQKRRTGPHRGVLELAVPSLLLVSAVGIAIYGLESGFMLAVYFAPVGVLVALPQLRALRSTPQTKGWWLLEHLSAMFVSTITTVTAFFVVNAGRFFGTLFSPVVWLAPTLLGVPLLIYWRRRYRDGKGRVSPAVSLE